ncbi:MAG TPA: OB-fold domain-containing protein, partial [Burkholderiales bacterium]|nr:OB-fold domain-containing protein [Burkholderiales bacterium]
VSAGRGAVHATTVVRRRGEAPASVVLVDLDEGFRMMSRVEGIDPMQVKIGMRVKVKINQGDEKQLPYPVFTPAEGAK